MKTDWGSATEIWGYALDRLDECQDLVRQQRYLSEDIAQVKFPNGKLIDVGWYHRTKDTEGFGVFIIGPGGWDEPEWYRSADNLAELRKVIREAIDLVEA